MSSLDFKQVGLGDNGVFFTQQPPAATGGGVTQQASSHRMVSGTPQIYGPPAPTYGAHSLFASPLRPTGG